MEQTFYMDGIEFIRWEDERGNIWEAVKEQVDVYGKECFQQADEDYIDEYFRNHVAASNMPEWI